jgi:hypothetical protein
MNSGFNYSDYPVIVGIDFGKNYPYKERVPLNVNLVYFKKVQLIPVQAIVL